MSHVPCHECVRCRAIARWAARATVACVTVVLTLVRWSGTQRQFIEPSRPHLDTGTKVGFWSAATVRSAMGRVIGAASARGPRHYRRTGNTALRDQGGLQRDLYTTRPLAARGPRRPTKLRPLSSRRRRQPLGAELPPTISVSFKTSWNKKRSGRVYHIV